MKRSIFALVMMLFIIFSLSGCGEKADSIVLPATEEITSIEIAGGMEDIICKDEAKIVAFIQKASESKPTAKQSTQDYPDVSQYTKVDIVQNGQLSTMFIYEKNSKWYIEQPYQGIYETDESILSMLEK